MATTFKIQVGVEQLCGQRIDLADSVILWVGRNRHEMIALGGSGARATMVQSGMSTSTIFIQNITIRLTKLFPNKQVLFSTDIHKEDDSDFWSEFYVKLHEYLTSKME
ncbi:hypothetical protein L596_008083 [Steinernema carpocapsae]|uniref:Proteasome assembly chaperone 3 n=1 Tax=Steinernema carpocapsae TaxID=34508 RepID=A0A4U5PBN4_STECR|nr:hypothetical protein L596_008083 [Steinernema carpocapsae]